MGRDTLTFQTQWMWAPFPATALQHEGVVERKAFVDMIISHLPNFREVVVQGGVLVSNLPCLSYFLSETLTIVVVV